MSKIKLPSKALGLFVQSANTWLSKTIEAKQGGLELRLANQDGNLHVSAGADGSYLEALLKCNEGDLEFLTSPLFLDIPSLASYAFDSEILYMTSPSLQLKEDQRVGFTAPGFNFRIPQKAGAIWKRNYFELEGIEISDFILDKNLFGLFFKNLELPDSFNSRNNIDLQVSVECYPSQKFSMFANDMGAYWHVFTSSDIQGKQTKDSFNMNFFTPCKLIEIEKNISFATTGPQCFGSLNAPEQGFINYRWMQPRYIKESHNIATAINQLRMSPVRSKFKVEGKSLIQNITRSCMLLSPSEMKSTSLELSTVGDQYNLKILKSTGDEVCAEGKFLITEGDNISVNIQASAFKDYLSEFSSKAAVNIEIYKDTILLEQDTEGSHLLYWMPLSVGG